MKNLVLIALISTSLLTFANNTTKLGKIEIDNNITQTTQTTQTEIVFCLNDNSNTSRDNSMDREDIIRKASIESTNRNNAMSLSNYSLK
ncbi:MAG: hypothetical protein WCP57_02525 [Bacteroidota bacterium]